MRVSHLSPAPRATIDAPAPPRPPNRAAADPTDAPEPGDKARDAKRRQG